MYKNMPTSWQVHTEVSTAARMLSTVKPRFAFAKVIGLSLKVPERDRLPRPPQHAAAFGVESV